MVTKVYWLSTINWESLLEQVESFWLSEIVSLWENIKFKLQICDSQTYPKEFYIKGINMKWIILKLYLYYLHMVQLEIKSLHFKFIASRWTTSNMSKLLKVKNNYPNSIQIMYMYYRNLNHKKLLFLLKLPTCVTCLKIFNVLLLWLFMNYLKQTITKKLLSNPCIY